MPGREQRTRRRGWLARSPAGLALALGACGSVGDPLPPVANLPEPVADLAVRQVDDRIMVAWTWPAYTTERAVARRLGGFTLWAVDLGDSAEELARETIDEHRYEVVRLEAEALPTSGPGKLVELTRPLGQWTLGQAVMLVLTAWNRAGRDAGYSNQVHLQPLKPPGPPLWSVPHVDEGGVALSWRHAERADSYLLERSVGAGASFEVLGRVSGTTFADRDISWGVQHSYRLRPDRRSLAGWIAGPPSETMTVRPVDRFPPAAPAGLRAVRGPGSVELSWLPNREADLAGYRVLRDGTALAPLISATNYSDVTALARTAHEYSLSAIDANGNESPTCPPLAVPVTLPEVRLPN